RSLVARENWLTELRIDTKMLEHIPHIKVKQMAAEAQTLNAYRMPEMEAKKRYALAISLASSQLAKVLDDIGEMIIKRMMRIHKQGRKRINDKQEKAQMRTDALIATFHDML